jgi:hypothetical protein
MCSLIFVARPVETGLTDPPDQYDRFCIAGIVRCWFCEFLLGHAHVVACSCSGAFQCKQDRLRETEKQTKETQELGTTQHL